MTRKVGRERPLVRAYTKRISASTSHLAVHMQDSHIFKDISKHVVGVRSTIFRRACTTGACSKHVRKRPKEISTRLLLLFRIEPFIEFLRKPVRWPRRGEAALLLRSRARRRARRIQLIVLASPCRVRQDIIGIGYGLEAFCGSFAFGGGGTFG